MAITVTSYGAAGPATTFLSEVNVSNSTGNTGASSSRTTASSFYESRNSTQTIRSSTTSGLSSTATGTGSSSSASASGSALTTAVPTVSVAVSDTATVSSVMATTETFIVDTDHEEGGYWDETTFSQTQTTRTASTATTTEGSAFTTSKDSNDKISFYSTTTTQSVTTSTTVTSTFETFGTSSASSEVTLGQESSQFVYAAPDEVLWIASATGFDSQAIITAVGSTATSHSRKLGNASTVNITTNNASVSWAESTHATLSETGSYTIQTFAAFTTTIIRTLTSFSVGTLTGNLVSTFSNRLPHLTDTYTTQTFTTSTSSYVRSSYSLVAAGGSGASSEALTSSVTFVSRYPVRIAARGLEYESLSANVVSTSFPYTRAIPGYSRVTESGATVSGNSLVTTAAPAWFYRPAVFSETSTSGFSNVHVLNRRTGGFMTYTDEVSGWLTGLTVSSDSSLATTITFAQHRRGRYVPLPGSFAQYTVSKDSFTYTRSTSTSSTTASTTTSTLLDLAGGTSRIEEGLRNAGLNAFVSGFGFYSAQTIGGGVPSGETNFANVVGPAKINNSTVSTFGGSLFSTTDTSGTASFVNALATMYAVTATGTANDIVTQRNITSMV